MMDFTFTDEQELFKKAAREFAETKIGHYDPGRIRRTGAGVYRAPDCLGRDQPGFCGNRHDVAGLCSGHRTHRQVWF